MRLLNEDLKSQLLVAQKPKPGEDLQSLLQTIRRADQLGLFEKLI